MTETAKSEAVTASDIPKGAWVDKYLPARIRPYARIGRFDRPIGTWLLLFPGWWSVSLATTDWSPGASGVGQTLWFFVLFGIGAAVMRGAGCTFNDISDREFDAKVARTADRPIPSGAVSVRQAIFYLVSLSLIGCLILIQFNLFAIGLGAASLLLVAVYPFMKRITYWPQFVLGLTFNWGALLGWAAVRGDVQAPALILYAAGIFWTLGYDTIYAHQDKEDDLIVGVKSSALRLGDHTRPWLVIFYVAAVVLVGLSGWLMHLSWPFYGALGLAALQASWQVAIVSLDDPDDCLCKFKSNRLFGWLLLAGFILGQII